jgi:hypothetical protein
MTALATGFRRNGGFPNLLGSVTALACLLGLCAFVVYRTPSPSATSFITLVGFAVIGGWMFLSERYELTLSVLLLYLLLLDGFLKLKTGSQFTTLGRDILFYAIVGGALARFLQRRKAVELPPLSGWVLAFTLIVLVSMFNPGSYPPLHAVASTRPHLEFVPLFFFGFVIMRDPKRLRIFLVLLLLCGAINGVVSAVQFTLTPDQLAAWGPGYSKFIKGGEDGLAGRTFAGADGKNHVRPFGLGADAGSGGLIATLAIPGAIALIGTGWRRPRYALVAIAMSVGLVTAVVTSQGRGVVIAAFVMLLAYVSLSVTSKRLVPTLAGIAVAGAVVAIVVSTVGGQQGSTLSRYDSIAPTKVLATTGESRGGSLALVPVYIQRFPFGHGLGTGGPATGFAQGERDPNAESFSAESEFSFMVLETGIVGLIITLGFTLRLLHLALTRLRRLSDPETRVLLAAVISPVFGIAALYIGGAPTAGSPLGPYFWFVAGIMSYWLLNEQSGSRRIETGRVLSPTSTPAIPIIDELPRRRALRQPVSDEEVDELRTGWESPPSPPPGKWGSRKGGGWWDTPPT